MRFDDSATMQMQSLKFRGRTENLESIHIMINGAKAGGSKVSDTDSFWKSWKRDPFANNAYPPVIRESPDPSVLPSTAIRAAV